MLRIGIHSKLVWLVLSILFLVNEQAWAFTINASQGVKDSTTTHELNVGLDAATLFYFSSFTLSVERINTKPTNNKLRWGYGVNGGYIFGQELNGLKGDAHKGIDYTGIILEPKFYLLLMGKKGNFFELNAGAGWIRVASTYDSYVNDLFMPEISMGFRKYFKNEKGIFRFGVSLPRGFYFGYAFMFR